MKLKFRNSKINSRSGNAILMALVLLGVVVTGITTSMIISSNYVNQAQNEKDEAERTQVYGTMKALLDDQRFCLALFSKGFNTESGTYPVTSNSFGTTLAPTMVQHEQAFDVYRMTSVQLSNEKILAADSNGVKYKQFDLAMNIEQKNKSFLHHFSKALGQVNDVATSKDAKLNIILTDNNRCFIHSNQADTASNSATSVAISCQSLGGTYSGGRCHMKEFVTDADGLADTSSFVGTPKQQTFTDALCALELSTLQKMGPQFMSQRTYAWTSLCQKPQWAGCRASGDVLGQMVLGNDPNSPPQQMPGATWPETSGTFNVDQTQANVTKITDPTFKRRMNRVAAALTNSTIGKTGVPSFTANNLSFGQVMSQEMSNPMAMGFGNPAMAAIMALFAPACNKARLQVAYRCTEGWSEVDQVVIQTQYLHIGFFGFSCRWRSNSGTYTVPTEYQIMSAVKSSGQPLNTFQPVTAAPDDVADINAMLAKISAVNTMAQLMALLGATDGPLLEGETQVPGVPQQLLAAFTQAEQRAWTDFSTTTQTQLATIATAPRAQLPTETSTSYTTYLTTFFDGQANAMSALDTTLNTNLAFSKSFVNPDGVTRDLSSTPVYNSTIKPLINSVNNAQSALVAAANAKGISIVLTDIASL